MILPNQAKHSSFACFGHCFSKALSTIFTSPHRRSVHILLLYWSVFLNLFYFPVRVNSSFLQFQTQKGIESSNDLLLFFLKIKIYDRYCIQKCIPRQKQNFPAYLPFLTSFLVSQHFCPMRLARVSFRACLSPTGTLNFLNTYSAMRKIRIILPWPQHEASWTFSLQECNSLNPLGNMTPARSCIWMGEERKWCLPCRPSSRPSRLIPSGVLRTGSTLNKRPSSN